jgi:hypothetical protein
MTLSQKKRTGSQAAPPGSPIGVFRFDEDNRDLRDTRVGELPEDDPVRTDFLAESSSPLDALQRLYIAPLRVVSGFQIVDGMRESLLHFAWKRESCLWDSAESSKR